MPCKGTEAPCTKALTDRSQTNTGSGILCGKTQHCTEGRQWTQGTFHSPEATDCSYNQFLFPPPPTLCQPTLYPINVCIHVSSRIPKVPLPLQFPTLWILMNKVSFFKGSWGRCSLHQRAPAKWHPRKLNHLNQNHMDRRYAEGRYSNCYQNTQCG